MYKFTERTLFSNKCHIKNIYNLNHLQKKRHDKSSIILLKISLNNFTDLYTKGHALKANHKLLPSHSSVIQRKSKSEEY